MHDEAAINYSRAPLSFSPQFFARKFCRGEFRWKLSIAICCGRAWSCHKASSAYVRFSTEPGIAGAVEWRVTW